MSLIACAWTLAHVSIEHIPPVLDYAQYCSAAPAAVARWCVVSGRNTVRVVVVVVAVLMRSLADSVAFAILRPLWLLVGGLLQRLALSVRAHRVLTVCCVCLVCPL